MGKNFEKKKIYSGLFLFAVDEQKYNSSLVLFFLIFFLSLSHFDSLQVAREIVTSLRGGRNHIYYVREFKKETLKD